MLRQINISILQHLQTVWCYNNLSGYLYSKLAKKYAVKYFFMCTLFNFKTSSNKSQMLHKFVYTINYPFCSNSMWIEIPVRPNCKIFQILQNFVFVDINKNWWTLMVFFSFLAIIICYYCEIVIFFLFWIFFLLFLFWHHNIY